ncbi:MAG: ribbon-helix-helix protein, CopG family [Desulfuromonadaceae bacterium]|nr:ribbon-helix-helix protein, CopG family [Desulfuromonadaceae bacterium]
MSRLVNIRIDDATRQRLDRLASATDRTRSHLVKKAIEEFLCANEWQVQAIETAIRQADAAEAVFVEHDRIDSWLNTWGSDKETERPR